MVWGGRLALIGASINRWILLLLPKKKPPSTKNFEQNNEQTELANISDLFYSTYCEVLSFVSRVEEVWAEEEKGEISGLQSQSNRAAHSSYTPHH